MRGLRTKALGGAAVLVASAALASPVMTTTAHAGSIEVGGHSIRTADKEAYLVVEAGKTATATVACPKGYFATSGGFLADASNTGDISSVFVRSTQVALEGTGWAVSVQNSNDGDAQGKVKVSCMARSTSTHAGHAHTFAELTSLGGTAVTKDRTATATTNASCTDGQIPITPGYESNVPVLVKKSAVVGKSFEFEFEVLEDGDGVTPTITVSAQCLATTLSESGDPAHKVAVAAVGVAEPVEIAPGRSEAVLACPAGTVSVVGSHTITEPGLTFVGGDPRGTQRMFRFVNDFDEATTASLGVTCLGAKVTPAREVTIGSKVTRSINGATVTVPVTCKNFDGKCTVTVKLLSKDGKKTYATGKATFKETKDVVLATKSIHRTTVQKLPEGLVKVAAGSVQASAEVTVSTATP